MGQSELNIQELTENKKKINLREKTELKLCTSEFETDADDLFLFIRTKKGRREWTEVKWSICIAIT